MTHPAEPLPGFIIAKDRYGNRFEFILDPRQMLNKSALSILIIGWPFYLAMTLPAIFYRISLKGSAVIYLPLIWIGHKGDTWHRIKGICTLSIHRFRRLLAVGVILLVASKIFFQVWWSNLAAGMSKYVANVEVTNLFLAPSAIPIWQIASAANGLLVWMAYFIADTKFKMNADETVGKLASFGLYLIWKVGAVLSLYTIAVLIYNVGSLEWVLPKIGECWTPWCGDLETFKGSN